MDGQMDAIKDRRTEEIQSQVHFSLASNAYDKFFMVLTHSHTMTPSDASRKAAF